LVDARWNEGLPDVSLALAGCISGPDSVIFTVQPSYPFGDFGRLEPDAHIELSLTGIGANDEATRDALRDTMRVFRVEDGAAIAGTSFFDWETQPVLRFVPEVPLSEGWHVVEADLGGLRTLRPMTRALGPRPVARFHVGSSAPIWYGTERTINWGSPTEGETRLPVLGSQFRGLVSRSALSPALEGTVAVAFDGAPAACSTARWVEDAFEVSCEAPWSSSDEAAHPISVTIEVAHPALVDLDGVAAARHSFSFGRDEVGAALMDPDLGRDLLAR
jgi:hypothetical protein